MSFSDKYNEVVYIMVFIKLHVGKYMDSGNYVCDLLGYNKVTWWNCDDYTITNFSGYLDNVYNNLSNENEQKQGGGYYEWIRKYCVNFIHKKRHSCI